MLCCVTHIYIKKHHSMCTYVGGPAGQSPRATAQTSSPGKGPRGQARHSHRLFAPQELIISLLALVRCQRLSPLLHYSHTARGLCTEAPQAAASHGCNCVGTKQLEAF